MEAAYPAAATYSRWQSGIDWNGRDSSTTGDPNRNGVLKLGPLSHDLLVSRMKGRPGRNDWDEVWQGT
jgi:hypothetical protein